MTPMRPLKHRANRPTVLKSACGFALALPRVTVRIFQISQIQFARALSTFALFFAFTAHAQQHIYSSNFSAAAGSEWNQPDIAETPAGHKFLGEFLHQKVSLKLDQLPPHQFIRLSFDLLILYCWDGSGVKTRAGDIVGPDFFRCGIAGRTLLWSTFSTTPIDPGFSKELHFQNYPSPFPGARNEEMTGAVGKNSLGFIMKYNERVRFPMDSTYRISMIIPHTTPRLQIDFTGHDPQPRTESRWGLDNVTIDVLQNSEVKQPTADEARSLLDESLGTDPIKAADAYSKLLIAGAGVKISMQGAITAAAIDQKAIEDAVKDLIDAPDYDSRAGAIIRLKQIGPIAEGEIWKARAAGKTAKAEKLTMAMLREWGITPIADEKMKKAIVAARVMNAIGE